MNFITQNEFYSSRDIKMEAKAQLKGSWKPVILLSLIPMLFSFFFIGDTARDIMNQSVRAGLIDLLFDFTHGFLITGVTYTLLDFLRNREEINPLLGSLQAFKREYFSRLFLLKVLQYFFILLWALLLVVPGIVKGYGYSQAEKIYKDTVDRTGIAPNPRDCLDQSQMLMYGHKMDLFTLDLSFIGWQILSVFTLGILNLWLTPYAAMSQVVFYENIVEQSDFFRSNRPDGPLHANRHTATTDPLEEIGRDPDDFSDFEDF